MTAPARDLATGPYVAGHTYFVDDLVPLEGMALHFYGEATPDDDCTHWLNFRIVEWAQVDDAGPLYPLEEHVRPGETTRDARAAVHFASGFIKWDGCCEVQMDHHMCGISGARLVVAALLHVFAYAAERHGFEDCE